MRNFRRKYYDVFSKYYDRFVALHSRDTQGGLRKFLSTKIPPRVIIRLDLVTI